MHHNPISTSADLANFETHGAYVKWEQRQPAAVSWWCAPGADRQGFTALAMTQTLRMSTSPAGRWTVRVIE